MILTTKSNSLIDVIEVTPIEMLGHMWLCIGFEEHGVHMGDAMHLAFLYRDGYKPSVNLMHDAERMFKGDACPLLRVHSECLLGDALYSDLCDCGDQLRSGLQATIKHGSGMILYLRQEGRGIGMRAKLSCLAAQEGYAKGIKALPSMSPDEANIFYGHKVDERTYDMIPGILSLLGVKSVMMMTGNMDKVQAVRAGGIAVVSLTDIDRSDVKVGSRKHRELSEKATRNYNYQV
jgi:GTP cyclohydrolase II